MYLQGKSDMKSIAVKTNSMAMLSFTCYYIYDSVVKLKFEDLLIQYSYNDIIDKKLSFYYGIKKMQQATYT